LEREYFGPHSRISEVQHPQAPILDFDDRFDAHEPVTEPLGERRERLELGSRVRGDRWLCDRCTPDGAVGYQGAHLRSAAFGLGGDDLEYVVGTA
jgi:hypothetical protein